LRFNEIFDQMPTARAHFIEPMLLQLKPRLPEGEQWLYELKLDGYRAIAFKAAGKVRLRSRNDKDFTARYPTISSSLLALPDETVIDGEVVAMDETGKPSFNLLQNFGSSKVSLLYYVFDVLILGGRDVMHEPLSLRRELLQREIIPKLGDPVRESAVLDASLPDLITAVKVQGLEGLVAKRRDSPYEPGQRSGAWAKMRVNRAQEFIIGGYTIGGRTFDALVFGYYDGQHLIYVARTRNGFTPSSRDALFRKFKGQETTKCPFVNLPEARSGRWGEGLTAVKMKDCVWLQPLLVGRFEFLEWTPDNHLRHAKFVALRDDTKPHDVIREDSTEN
jgi:bifunctional non-homologous end joining protein LigD